MPPTPAKRVTRSRAAATKNADEMNAPAKRVTAARSTTSRRPTADVEDRKKAENTIAGAAAKRPVQTAFNPAPTITTARRRIRVTPLDGSASDDKSVAEATVEKPATKKPKSSSKGKKEAHVDEAGPDGQQQLDNVDTAPKPKTRRRAAADKEKLDDTQTAPRTRGRPKKSTMSEQMKEPQQQQPVRQTRTRAGSGASVTQATAATTAKATAASRKKVTFQDLPESDKENQPLVAKKVGSKSREPSAAGGIRARPVRKPATAKGRKTAGTTNKDATEEPRPTPLSPKKVTQVARSSSPGASDEDELSGAKTPVRDLSQSPKRSAVRAGALSPAKKLDFGTALLAKSPDRGALGTTLMSPPRKLPPSPFKDALKESPRRGEGTWIFPPSALKATMASALSAPSAHLQSVLLQSPRRGAIDSSIFTQSAIKPSKSPAKPTLMQSPPKRLFPSFKPSSAEAAPAGACNVPTAPAETHPGNEPGDVVVSCNFRASQSPERSIRVHKITSDDLALGVPASLDFDDSILDIRSPIKVSKPAWSSLHSTNEEAESLPVFSTELSPPRLNLLCPSSCQDQVESSSTGGGEPMEGVATSLEAEKVESASASTVTAASKDMPSFLFRSTYLRDDDDDSEDELQAENPSFRDTLTETPRISCRNIRSRLSTVNPVETSMNVGFTPLAAQFSSWLAASPDKALRKDTQQRGGFSPLAAQHVPGKVQISRQSTPHRRSVGSRLSTATVTSADRHSTTATPERSSYFADEMAVKDLEDEVESLQVTREEEAAEAETKSPGVVRNTELLALLEEKASETIADTKMIGVDGASLLEEAADETEVRENENEKENKNITAQTATPQCLFPEADAEANATEANTQNLLAGEESALAVDGDLIEGSEAVKLPGREPENEVRAARPQPTTSMEDYATPTRPSTILPRFMKTVVSKVPLRPEGSISPIKNPKKRSRSLSGGPSSARKPIFAPSLLARSNMVNSLSPERQAKSPSPSTPGQQSFVVDDFGDSTLDGIEIDEDDENLPPSTPFAPTKSTLTTPGRSPLDAVENGVLQGAVVFVDVHTTEGADASGIFVELLTHMGARCVRQWNWNPRASIAGGEAETVNMTPGGLAGKVGITHVIYKDGGKRTLEKVRDSEGVVRCVGVGWVLDCERENAWLDEAQYAVDISLVPRGGSRRRKSMEPRALINMNGSLSAVKGRRSVSAEMTPAMKADLVATPVRAGRPPLHTSPEEAVVVPGDDSALNSLDSSFSTPTGVQAAFTTSATPNTNSPPAFATPTGHVNYDPSNEMSPTTPYYLSQGAKLVQQTCPPKQTQKGLFDTDAESGVGRGGGLGFPVTGRIEDQPDESVRIRLEAARRKTMNWRPRVASPLGR